MSITLATELISLYTINMLEIIGIGGALIILYTFIMNQLGKLSADSFMFDFWNLLGSSALLYYAYESLAIPFVLINGVWALTSLKDVLAWIFSKEKRNSRKNSL